MAEVNASRIPRGVHEVCERLASGGHRAWVVGGCIRDLLMDRAVSDWDLATDARPDEVAALFRRTIPTGIEHGTVTVLHDKEGYEVTTLRGEGAYTDGRRPDSVEFVSDIEEDLARRDFTVNAIAYDPLSGSLVDPWGGMADLERKLIRAVRDPDERFGEDGLRVLRAARFCASLEFELEAKTEAAIPHSLETFRRVSPERVSDEWRKAFAKAARPSIAFVVMRRTGILAVSCAPLAALPDPAFEGTMTRTDRCTADPGLRLASLLLDIPADATWADGWLRGMKLSNQVRRRVLELRKHRPWVEASTEAGAFRCWMRDVGRAHLADVLALWAADGADVHGLQRRIDAELAAGLPLQTKELPVNGKDVLAQLDGKPGRLVGQVLERLLLDVYEEPAPLGREALLERIPDVIARVQAGPA
ncbi:MAG: CCA tRNA nucleotidyltransferase [Sandaracinaceae bacterium]